MNQPIDAGIDNTDLQGQTPGQGAADQSALTGVLISDNGDGSFNVTQLQDGQPQGEATPAASIDAAMQAATSVLSGVSNGGDTNTPSDASANPDASGDAGQGVNPDASGDQGATSPADDAAAGASDDAKAQYAKKRGTRPKTAPSWSDYMTGGNPTAK